MQLIHSYHVIVSGIPEVFDFCVTHFAHSMGLTQWICNDFFLGHDDNEWGDVSQVRRIYCEPEERVEQREGWNRVGVLLARTVNM